MLHELGWEDAKLNGESIDQMFDFVEEVVESPSFEVGYEYALDMLNSNIDEWQEATQEYFEE